MTGKKKAVTAALAASCAAVILFAAILLLIPGGTVIANYKGTRVFAEDYGVFIEFNSRLAVNDKKSYIITSLCRQRWLLEKGVTVTDGEKEECLKELTNRYFGKSGLISPYDEIVSACGIDEDELKTSFGHFAFAAAVEKKYNETVSVLYEAQDKSSPDYTESKTEFENKIADEVSKYGEALYSVSGKTVGEMSASECDYKAAFDFFGKCDKYDTVSAIVLYTAIEKQYGSKADRTELEAYIKTIESGIKRISGYRGILNDMGKSEEAFFAEAKKYYSKVFLYEQMTGGYFEELFTLKQTAGTLPHGVTTLEQFVSYILTETASDCEIYTDGIFGK